MGNISVAAAVVQNYCAVTIEWESVEGVNYQSDSVFRGLGAGRFSFNVRDANGNSSPTVANIFNRCHAVTATATADSCNQGKGSVEATGSSGTAPYLFSIDGVNFQVANAFGGLRSGNYNVSIKDAHGFTSTALIEVLNNCIHLAMVTENTTCSRKMVALW